MALEDAVVLEVLLADVTGKDDVERRLELFEKLRLPRAGTTQAFSNYMMAGGAKMVEEVRKRYNGPILPPDAKTFSPAFCDFFFSYNILEEAQKALQEFRDRCCPRQRKRVRRTYVSLI